MSLGASPLYLFIPGSEWKLVAHEEAVNLPTAYSVLPLPSCVNMTHQLTLQSKNRSCSACSSTHRQ